MKSRDMLKLVQASNKSLSREKILKAMGSQIEFKVTDINWIINEVLFNRTKYLIFPQSSHS